MGYNSSDLNVSTKINMYDEIQTVANPEIKSVEVDLLIDQKFYLDEVYRIFPDYIRLSETEKEQYKTNVKVSLYDDFYIPLSTIFLNVK